MKLTLLVACLAVVRVATAQTDSSAASATPAVSPAPPAATDSAAATYRARALRVEATWKGLAVVRGAAGTPVANLSFFWPHDVTDSVRGDILAPFADSVALNTRLALSLRQGGAFLTDAAGGVFALGALHALINGGMNGTDATLAGIGVTLLGISLPLQFAADNALSRAVWWHNLRLIPSR